MTRKNSVVVNDEKTIKAEKFELDWPAKLQLEPKFKIEVSPTRSAYVYEDAEHASCVNNSSVVTQKGYRVMFVITSTGLPPIKQDNYYGRQTMYGAFYNNLLDVRYAIIEYSQAHRPRVVTENQKVKRVVGTEEYEED